MKGTRKGTERARGRKLALFGQAAIGAAVLVAGLAWAQSRSAEAEIDVRSYTVDAAVDPVEQTLRATVTVEFMPMEAASTLTFELNDALELHNVTDATGRPVANRRMGGMKVQVLPIEPFPAEQLASLTFSYAGRLTGNEESPVWGIKFAAIHEDFAYLMYPSRWFPISGYTTDRFNMDLRVTTPEGYRVVASGEQSVPTRAELQELRAANGAIASGPALGAAVAPGLAPAAVASTVVSPASPEEIGERPKLLRRTGAEGAEPPAEPASAEPEPAGEATPDVSSEILTPDISIEAAEPGAQVPDIVVESTGAGTAVADATPIDDGLVTTRFQFEYFSFPGSFAVVRDEPRVFNAGGLNTRFYVREGSEMAGAYATEIGNAAEYLSSVFGPLPSQDLAIVETEDGSRNYAAPGILFLAPAALSGSSVYMPPVVNQLARQWWGVKTSASTRNHMWIENGMARYAEILYTEETEGRGAMAEQVHDTYVEALTVEQPPMIQAARLEDYSPEYLAITAGKGAAVLNMLRGVMGDDKFFELLKRVPRQFSWNALDSRDFQDIAEEIYGDSLNGFFLQWLESSGAPEFTMDYTVFRTQEGFRVNGRISQDLDLFRMPVKLRIETEGNPEEKTVIVSGTSSEFAVETFGKPVDVVLDPDGEVLRYSDDMRVAVAIRRGEQFAEVNDFLSAINEYEKALQVNRNSSLAHYRVGEAFFLQGNLQEAANRFRNALDGDLQPAWTEVWSHIHLGWIFDITDSRDRAVNEYRQALRTRDNTSGALEEAEKYLNEPYQRERPRY